jgi:hypothetical protein
MNRPSALPSAAAPGSYVPATRFNWRELTVLLILLVVLLAALALPWFGGLISRLTGTNLDTYKRLPEQATAADLLPELPDRREVRQTAGGAAVNYGSGARAEVEQYASHRMAVASWDSRWQEGGRPADVKRAGINRGLGMYLARGRTEEEEFVEWVNGPFILRFSGLDEERLEALIAASALIDLPGELTYRTGPRPFGAKLMGEYFAGFCLVLDLLILLFLWGLAAGGLKLATRRPKKGMARISRDGLRDQLLALNNPRSAFVIEEVAPYHLVGRWKLDLPEYRTLFAKHGQKQLYQLDLYLNADGPVGALETRGSVSWDMSMAPPSAAFRWDYFRGLVLFEWRAAKVWTLDPADLTFKEAVDYKFNVNDYRVPVIRAVTGAGWTYRPLLLRPLIWRG